MVGQSPTALHELVAICPADKTIEQTVSVNMTRLLAVKKETDPTEAVHAELDARPTLHFSFDFTYRPKPTGMKETCRAKQ
jgi:hypothetical protein